MGAVAPTELAEARWALHHAVQLVAAVGASLLEPRADDSHPNLAWSDSQSAFVGHLVPGKIAFAAALRPDDLNLALVDDKGIILVELGLVGQTLDDGLAWLDEETRTLGASVGAGGIRLPGYELPEHPVTSGAPFTDDPQAGQRELARWYAGAERVLTSMTVNDGDASSVRIWPHHFDIATLLTVARDESGASVRTVGVGLSPGDGSYSEPYWYVSPWPHPDTSELPDLKGAGHWHDTGFTAAILTGSDVLSAGRADARSRRIDAFLREAVAACRRALSD